VNVLEFDVFNGDERRLPNSFMAFRTELTGMALGNPMRTSDDNPPSDRGKEGIPMN